MHELALAQDALRKAQAKVKEKAIKSATFIKFGIGATRITHPAEFKELFAEIAKGTALEHAKVEIEIIPLKSICADCNRDFVPDKPRLDCPHCGSSNLKIVGGNELVVKELK